MPSTKYFCAAKKRRTSGRTATQAMAITRPHTTTLSASTERRSASEMVYFFDRVDEDQGVEVIVIGPQELEQASGEEGRLHQRQQDLPEDAEGATTINAGGFVQIAGDAAHELDELIDEEWVAGQQGGTQNGM